MSLISALYPYLRIVLGDLDDVQQYSDTNLANAVRCALKMGDVPGYALTVDETGITPDLTNTTKFALTLYKVARLFVASNPSGYSYRRRAVSETFGSYREFLAHLNAQIFALESGDMFGGWQSFHNWLAGMYGLPIAQYLTDVTVDAPFQTANISSAGVSVS